MIMTLTAVLAVAGGGQTDTTRAAREAFTSCLRAYVERSVEAQMELGTFQTEYPQACSAEQAAFRSAIIQRETGLRATRASAEETAELEIEDARVNFSERFEMAISPE